MNYQGRADSLCPAHLLYALDKQHSDNGVILKLVKDLYGSTLERGLAQLFGELPVIMFLNATFCD